MNNDLESKIQLLLERIDRLEQEKSQSADVTSIMPALIKAQGAIPNIGAGKMGVHAKYAPLPEIWEAVKGPLQANGLFLTQGETILPDKSTLLVTKVMHTSGQWIQTSHLLRSKAELQGSKDVNMAFGGQLTYFKRYSLCGLLAIFVDRDLVEEDKDTSHVAGNEKLDYVIKRLSSQTEKGIAFRIKFLSERGITDIDEQTPTELINEMYSTLQEMQRRWVVAFKESK